MFSRMGTAQAAGEVSEPWMPRVDIKRTGDDMQIRAELPGMKPEDVDLEVSDGVLTIKGERQKESESEDEGWLVRESSYGSFMRSVALPESVDPSSITADYHDGVLEMRIPKAFKQMEPKATKIQIGAGEAPAVEKGVWTETEPAQSPSKADREALEQDVGSRK